MSDLTERLREGVQTAPGCSHPIAGDVDAADALMAEAADEIDRLTRELAEARDKALEEAAKVAARFGPDRPLAERRPAERILGRWEGEQAASTAIAAAIRALKEKP